MPWPTPDGFRDPVGSVHPWIDFIVDAEVVGRAHQQTAHRDHPNSRASSLQKRRRVHDQTDGLESSLDPPVSSAQPDSRRHKRSASSREEIAGRHRVQRRGNQQGKPHFGDCRPHCALRRDESVMTPGSGPSSRIVPAITTWTPLSTHAAIMPDLIMPVSTAVEFHRLLGCD